MNDIQTVITMENAKISCNFDQVETAIQEVLSEYKGAVFTEDSKAYAKKVVANLRAQKKTFQDNLREEKKKYMTPWEEFEVKAKQLIALYDEPINLINEQVQAFEEKRIAEKKNLIINIYFEIISDELKEYIPLERIYNPRWENATMKEKDIRREIMELSEKTAKDIDTINSMNSEAVPNALDIYRISLDVAEAVSYINNYEQQKKEILAKEQERMKREEEERIRRDEREKMLAEQKTDEEKEAALRQAREDKENALRQAEIEKANAVEQAKAEGAQEIIDSLIPDADNEAELYEYRISLSNDAKKKLEMYMDSVGIEWELIV